MKRILLIGTGGTIASRPTDGALAPQISTEEILSLVPSVRSLCHVDAQTVLNIDSTNIEPRHWLLISEAIRESYGRYDGFVVSHGTDTMAYSAAALSYLIQNSPKPIVFTGAQKPIVAEGTDSKANLFNSFLYASSDVAAGVVIVFDGRVILGTRARKVRSKSFDAFMSINYPDLASLQDGKLLSYIRLPKDRTPAFHRALNARVGLLKLIPGTDPGALSYYLLHNDAVIIESYGVGGVPALSGQAFSEALIELPERGKTVVLTTQVQLEGSDIGVYQTGHALKGMPGILEAYDMTTEAVVTKLLWILSETKDPAKIRALFYTPVANDILSAD